ncbi:MAG: hypothetical protein WAT74_05610, partial [Flavobacteriales bacterium]
MLKLFTNHLRTASLCIAAILAMSAFAQHSYTTLGVPYTQNFDGMGSSGTAAFPTGWRANNVAASVATDWDLLGTIATLAYGTTGGGAVTGTSGGGTINWANGITASSTDRSIGFLTSGSYTSGKSVAFHFENNTGVTVTELAVSFDYEKYRAGTRAFNWNFFHGPGTNATIAATAGDQFFAADAANAVVNPPTTTSKSFSITGLSIAPGTTYTLRWQHTGVGGHTNSQGMGVDNFSMTALQSATIITELTGFTGAFGNVNVGSSSAGQTFTVSGSSLTDDLEVLAPAGFEVSLDGSDWSVNPLVLVPTGGTVTSTTIHVRFSPGAAIAYSDDVTCSSTGATSQLVAVSGTGIAVSTPTKLAFTSINSGDNVIEFTSFSVTVQAQDDDDNPQDVTVDTDVLITLDQGFNTLSGTLTGTILAGTNSVVINGLEYDAPETDLVLRAEVTAGDALADALSPLFNVLGAAQDLSFSNTPPSGLTSQVLSAFQVDAMRADATVATEFNGSITISVLFGPGNIAGTLTQTAVNGTATFNDITLDAPGLYVLTATASGLNDGNSPAITITDQPTLTEVIFPQYAVNGTTAGTRLPYVCRLQLDNLVPNVTYRYVVGASTNPSLGLATSPGNMYAINNTAGAFGFITGQTSAKSVNAPVLDGDEFTTLTRSAELTTDGNGSYTGWFSMVPSANAVFDNGNDVYFYVQLNNGFGGLAATTSVRSTNTISMIIPSSSARAARGISSATDENMIFLYDNEAGTGRPIWGTWAENDGIDQTYTTWYDAGVDGQSGRWGAYLPTALPNGIRRIEQRSTATGDLVNCPGLSATGTWTGAGSTVNPTSGTTPIVFTTDDANFDAPTTWYADADGDGLGDPNDTQEACTQPEDYVAVAGDDCPLVEGTIGSPCDDEDETTINDVLQNDCTCAGQNVDCEGTPEGPALPGTPCDDEDPATGNDTWNNQCECVGELIDCENVIGGPALPGTPCDDEDPTTGN